MPSPASQRLISVAALQMAFGEDMAANIAAVVERVHAAAQAGAQVILPPELFQGPYFCKHQEEDWQRSAFVASEHPAVHALQPLAARYGIVIPTSIYERDGPHYYNSLVMLGTKGEIMGTYRKSHIPDGPGYQEKFYFRPGNTGFKVWHTPFGCIGAGICWDQWYPECARAMMLMGAEILLYPTAIGAEPHDPGLDTRRLWQRAMVGHAVSNVVPIVAANRIGDEPYEAGTNQRFYGCSFIADHRGDMVAQADDTNPATLMATFDLETIAQNRFAFGFFRDRRPELYQRLVQDL
jgi:N-carbamoylputrescine amidase